MISSQRPAVVFLKQTDEQFREYILGIFQELIEDLTKIRR
jgi:hypothetical protein